MPDTMLETLGTYIAAEFLKQPGRTITPQELLLSSGLVDSFHLLDLSLFVEDQFRVRLDDTELNALTFDNLEQLIALIRSKQ
jgi:acyl carrier protein